MEMRPWQKDRAAGVARLTALALGLSFFVGGCVSPPPPGPPVTHVVLMWLKHPRRAEDRAQLNHVAHSLRMMPGVTQVRTGGPIPPLGPHARPDFDMAVVVTFRDRASLRRFERDPRRDEALRRFLEPLVKRYEIYDLGDR